MALIVTERVIRTALSAIGALGFLSLELFLASSTLASSESMLVAAAICLVVGALGFRMVVVAGDVEEVMEYLVLMTLPICGVSLPIILGIERVRERVVSTKIL